MEITNMKINGLVEPKGFDFSPLRVSWLVTEAKGTKQKEAIVQVAKTTDFSEIIYQQDNANQEGTLLEFELEPRTSYYVKVSVVDDENDTASSVTTFETGKMQESWQGEWIGIPKNEAIHPIISHQFDLSKEVTRARVYLCGLGLYEAYLNGKKIGNEVLAPFLNNYDERLQVETYDITDLLAAENKIEILLGEGWYKGRFGLQGEQGYFGDQFAAIAELHVEFQDGEEALIATSEDWLYQASDIIESGIYDGEIIDRTCWLDRENPLKSVVPVELNKKRLKDRISPPLRIRESLPVKEIIHTPAGELVLDMGQNFAGWFEFEADFPKGTEIHLEFGEILQAGNFYNGNYGIATAGFTYISDGRKETVRPHFTYFGFRYVRVTGWPGEIKSSDFVGLAIYSELEQIGSIETGHEKINRLYQNSLWGLKSNFIDMPTDCPQRAERLGWTGDAQVFASTASYHMDTRAFYHKFLVDMRTEQELLNGSIPNYMPAMGTGGGAAVWGDAATIIPMSLMKFYNEPAELAVHYPMMKEWVNWIDCQLQEKYQQSVGLVDLGFQFGDWLGLDGATSSSFQGGTDNVFIATIYYYHSLTLVAEAATLIGKEEEAQKYRKLAEQIREVLLAEYYTPSGRLSVDTQAAYIIALKFKVYRKQAVIIEQLKNRLKKDLYKIKCGFVGAPIFCQVLAENQLMDLAYDFLLQEDFPSWLYAVNLGATTIWERWNSVLPDGSMNPAGMNSLNHYSYGSVMEFVYQSIVGIKGQGYGFSKVILAPNPSPQLGFAKGSYQSTAGKFVSEWQIDEAGYLNCHFEVPFNAEATIVLPYSDAEPIEVTAGSYDFYYQPTKNLQNLYDGDTRMTIIMKDVELYQKICDKAPRIGEFLAGADEDQRNKSLNELSALFYTGITQEMVAEALAILAAKTPVKLTV